MQRKQSLPSLQIRTDRNVMLLCLEKCDSLVMWKCFCDECSTVLISVPMLSKVWDAVDQIYNRNENAVRVFC